MNITITGKDLKATDAIKEYIEKKAERLVKYFGDEFEVNATIKTEGSEQVAQIDVKMGTDRFRAVTAHKDLYASIDKDIDILEGQIRKHKAKLKKYKTFAPVINDTTDIVDEPEEQIVKRKILEIKPMDEEEAILQMNLLNHDFFVFYDPDFGGVNVVYRRKAVSYTHLTLPTT
mgnify:CR=1 FL=1